MNINNALSYMRLVQALVDGKQLQEWINGVWVDIYNIDFKYGSQYYRVKPEVKKQWYRVALIRMYGTKPFGTITVSDEEYEQLLEMDTHFIKWLTERTEYTLPTNTTEEN